MAVPSTVASVRAAVYSRAMARIEISLPRLRSHIETLSTYGRNPDGRGITRSCWSPVHEQARAWLLGKMKEAGLETHVDPAGNTFGRIPGDGAAVLTGSHIDTVPEGGPLDGALGVLAGLECLQTIRQAGLSPRRPLAVVAWSDERHVGETRARYAAKRDVLLPVLAERGWEVVASEATMYLWVAIPTGELDQAVATRLLEHGILVSPGTFFGPSGAGYVRLALVPTLEECRRAAAILSEVL